MQKKYIFYIKEKKFPLSKLVNVFLHKATSMFLDFCSIVHVHVYYFTGRPRVYFFIVT